MKTLMTINSKMLLRKSIASLLLACFASLSMPAYCLAPALVSQKQNQRESDIKECLEADLGMFFHDEESKARHINMMGKSLIKTGLADMYMKKRKEAAALSDEDLRNMAIDIISENSVQNSILDVVRTRMTAVIGYAHMAQMKGIPPAELKADLEKYQNALYKAMILVLAEKKGLVQDISAIVNFAWQMIMDGGNIADAEAFIREEIGQREDILTIKIEDVDSVGLIRKSVKDFCDRNGIIFGNIDMADLELVASEMATNVIKYFEESANPEDRQKKVKVTKNRGIFVARKIRGGIGNKNGIEVFIIDQGQGIKDIQKAKQTGVSTGKTLGEGFHLAKECSSGLYVNSNPGKGTIVSFVKLPYYYKGNFDEDVDMLWLKVRESKEFELSEYEYDIKYFKEKYNCDVMPITKSRPHGLQGAEPIEPGMDLFDISSALDGLGDLGMDISGINLDILSAPDNSPEESNYSNHIKNEIELRLRRIGFDPEYSMTLIYPLSEIVNNVADHAEYGFALVREFDDEACLFHNPETTEQKAIEVFVIDKGKGIKDVKSAVRQAFSTGQLYSQALVSHAGLGLYIAEAYAKKRDFDIESVTFGTDKGTKVKFVKWLPLEKVRKFSAEYEEITNITVDKALEAGLPLRSLKRFMKEFVRFESRMLNMLGRCFGISAEGADRDFCLNADKIFRVHQIIFTHEDEDLDKERSMGITGASGDRFIINLNKTHPEDLERGLYWSFAHRYGHLLSLEPAVLSYGLPNKMKPKFEKSSYAFDYDELKIIFFKRLARISEEENLSNNPYFDGLNIEGIASGRIRDQETDDPALANAYAELVASRIEYLIMIKDIRRILDDPEWQYQRQWLQRRFINVFDHISKNKKSYSNWKSLPLEYLIYSRQMGFLDITLGFERLFDEMVPEESKADYKKHINIMSELWEKINFRTDAYPEFSDKVKPQDFFFSKVDAYKDEDDPTEKRKIRQSFIDNLNESYRHLPQRLIEQMKREVAPGASIESLWELMQEVTPLALLDSERGWRVDAGGVRKTAFVDVENSVAFMQSLEDYKKTRDLAKLYEFILSKKDPAVKRINRSLLNEIVDRFTELGQRPLLILNLSVIFHDYAKILGLTEGALYSGIFTRGFGEYLVENKIISPEECELLIALITLRPDFNTLQYGEGLPRDILAYLDFHGVDAKAYFALAPFLYLVDVSIVKGGRVSNTLLDNVLYLADPANMESLDRNWGWIRLKYGFFGEGNHPIRFKKMESAKNSLAGFFDNSANEKMFTQFLDNRATFVGYSVFIFRNMKEADGGGALLRFLYILSNIESFLGTSTIVFLPTYDEKTAAEYLVSKMSNFNMDDINKIFSAEKLSVRQIMDCFGIPLAHDEQHRVLTIDLKKCSQVATQQRQRAVEIENLERAQTGL